ncbi:MAG: BMC domain-containing protein [Candidatus Delongbacteria bacterium]|nr:BMC domain-containing protein [Candidatus Delongbacteria bacterium]
MTPKAIGMVETEGLVAAIEACDAMLKAAQVKLVEQSVTHPALVTILVEGEVAAVRSAVDAGAVAAARIGRVVGTHVIARPHETLQPAMQEPPHNPHIQKTTPGQSSGLPREKDSPPVVADVTDVANLDDKSVVELRFLARRLPHFPLTGRQISRARRHELLERLQQYFATNPPSR